MIKAWLMKSKAGGGGTINLKNASTVCHQWVQGGGSGWEAIWSSFGKYGATAYAHVITFPAAAIPVGATIVSAYPKWKAATNYSGDTCSVNLYFTAADNPSHPANATAAEALSLTGAIPWSSIGHWTSGTTYSGPDMSTILQAIINRAGWASGNKIQMVCRDNGSSNGGYRAGHENATYDLEITYTT